MKPSTGGYGNCPLHFGTPCEDCIYCQRAEAIRLRDVFSLGFQVPVRVDPYMATYVEPAAKAIAKQADERYHAACRPPESEEA